MKEQLCFEDRQAFRSWLELNADDEGVWLVFSKSPSLRTLKPDEALEEALCFGWIDGQMKKLDEEKYIKYFSPRRKGSNWSDRNKKLTEKLIASGIMTQGGLDAIDRAKKEGMWDSSNNSEISQDEAGIFIKAISSHDKALENFLKMSKSVQKQFIGLYRDAKKEETRKKRLDKLIGLLEANKKPM